MQNDTKRYAVEEKWGEAAKAGFGTIPDVLLKHQATLGLTDTEFVVLINICSYWWSAERLPFPRTATIAQRMGGLQRRRTVERALRSLRAKGLIWKVPRAATRPALPDGYGPEDRGRWDLSGLKARLEGLAKRDPQYLRKVGQAADARAQNKVQVALATG